MHTIMSSKFKPLVDLFSILYQLRRSPWFDEAKALVLSADPYPHVLLFQARPRRPTESEDIYRRKMRMKQQAHELAHHDALVEKTQMAVHMIPIISAYLSKPPPPPTSPSSSHPPLPVTDQLDQSPMTARPDGLTNEHVACTSSIRAQYTQLMRHSSL